MKYLHSYTDQQSHNHILLKKKKKERKLPDSDTVIKKYHNVKKIRKCDWLKYTLIYETEMTPICLD